MSRDDSSLFGDDLYREILLDHARSPRHRGRLSAPSHQHEGVNPSCGDTVEIDLLIHDRRVMEVAFRGAGCSISQASASMLTEGIRGRSLEEVRALAQAFKARQLARGELPEPPPGVDLGELEALDGVRRYPVRIKCALLAWNTLLEVLKEAEPGP